MKSSISWYILKQRFMTFSRQMRLSGIPFISISSNSSLIFWKKYIMFIWFIRCSRVFRHFDQCLSMMAVPSFCVNSSELG